jgi:hypothetical protein
MSSSGTVYSWCGCRERAALALLPPAQRRQRPAADPPADLRHGAASLALAAGADLKVVQDMLGHSSIVLTADTYTSVLPEVAHKVAEDIASLIIAAGCLVPGTQERRRLGCRSCASMPTPCSPQGSATRILPGRSPARTARRQPG